VPPAQCPECGRFLSKTFVTGLAVEPAPCPKCATELTAAHFEDLLGQAAAPDGPVEEPAGAAELREEQPTVPAQDRSVRPPDLDPGTVGAGERDPLAGWDEGDVVELERFRDGVEPPPEIAIIAGAAAAGAVAGAVVAAGHRHAREILDSRGNPTVEVEVRCADGSFGRAAVPSGASTGEFEAVELRDGGDRYLGKGVSKAVQRQRHDRPGAPRGRRDPPSAPSTRCCSTSTAPTTSRTSGPTPSSACRWRREGGRRHSDLALYEYLGGPNAHLLPVPMMNILNGGATPTRTWTCRSS
jgi:hypothetical protein